MERKSEETAITRKDEPNRDKGKEFERNDSILRVKVPNIVKCFAPLNIYHVTPFNESVFFAYVFLEGEKR